MSNVIHMISYDISVNMYINTYIYIYRVHMYINVLYIYVYIYMYMYTYSHIHIYISIHHGDPNSFGQQSRKIRKVRIRWRRSMGCMAGPGGCSWGYVWLLIMVNTMDIYG